MFNELLSLLYYEKLHYQIVKKDLNQVFVNTETQEATINHFNGYHI